MEYILLSQPQGKVDLSEGFCFVKSSEWCGVREVLWLLFSRSRGTGAYHFNIERGFRDHLIEFIFNISFPCSFQISNSELFSCVSLEVDKSLPEELL